MLYGRDAERSSVAALLDDARAGRSGVLVLRGEPGVGKSALLDDARRQAGGMAVLSSCGIESEAQLPYAGLHQLLRPVLGELDTLPEPQARALRGALGLEVGAADEWFLVSLAVLSLLAEAAERRPLLCLVDDAHWLDDASAESLVFAARRLEAEGLAMLFAAREGELRSFEAPGLAELRLGGLDLDAAGALLDQHVGASLSPEARARLIEGTDGNPLALLELCSTLSEAQLAGTAPLLDPLPVGARIERAFLARVRGLPEDTQTLLLVAAADDGGVPATVLGAAAVLGVPVDALDAGEQAGLLRVRASRLEFRHPLIRSAVYQAAPFSRRQAAHRALASVLAGDADADRRAWHRAAASVEPDASVAEELEEAARRAQRRSGFVAASLGFERAAALVTDERHKLQLLIDAVDGAWLAGRLERALMLLERARPFAADPSERAEIDRWRGLIELNVGVPADACELLVRAAPDMAAADAVQALYMLSLACIGAGYAGERATGTAIAQRADQIRMDDAPLARFLANFVRGMCAYFAGDFDRAAWSFRDTLQLADQADAADEASFRGLFLLAGGAGLFLGDDRLADRLNRRVVTRARETGAISLLTQALPRLALTEVPAGRWSSAAAGLNEGLQLARQTCQHQVVAHMLATLALVAAVRGEEEECRSLAAESHELASTRRLVHVALTARWALLLLELGLGRPDEALLCAREITEPPLALWAGPDRIEAAIRASDTQAARDWLAGFEPWAQSSGAAWARAAVLRCRALLSGDDEAEQLFAAALDAHGEASRPFERARTELAFGEFLRRSRRRLDSREHLRNALDGFDALGATLWTERASVELRASGQMARRREPSTRDDLTAQELQIARFVARGSSNREVAAQLFLSPRTIDFHLRNIFRKLGISSRIQLVALDLDGEHGSPAGAEPAITPAHA
jgi:DNA-binding NarL/FixJ family response regulator/predicted ATPase